MPDDRWDVPNERLRRIAEADMPAHFRVCQKCGHRHSSGDLCGYQLGVAEMCRCRQ